MNAKSIKEFFIPTKVKVLLYIFLFTPVIYILYHYICPSGGFCANIAPPTIIIIEITAEIIFPLTELLNLKSNEATLIVLALSSIFFYFFTCLIIFFYKYIEKTKHNLIKFIFVFIIIFTLIIPLPTMYLTQLEYLEWQERINAGLERPVTVGLERMEFGNLCSQLYFDLQNPEDYCKYYFKGNYWKYDWNENGIENESVELERKSLKEACENRIYCFLIHPYENRNGNISIEKCAEILCKDSLRKYKGNVVSANKAVLEMIKPGNCNLPDNNWHSLYFPENVCEKYINNTKE